MHISTMDTFIKCIQLLKIHQIIFLMISFIGYKLGTGEAEKNKNSLDQLFKNHEFWISGQYRYILNLCITKNIK